MNWTLCMQTPAGEKQTAHSNDLDLAGLGEKYAGLPSVRILLAVAMRWLDGHVNEKFEVNPPLAGPNPWAFYAHKEEEKCPLCTTS